MDDIELYKGGSTNYYIISEDNLVKLGIVVVYLVSEDNERLLDIHLQKIIENTTSPFTIYAGTNMLLPQFVNKLKQHEFVKLCDCDHYVGPNEDSRGAKEHSFYLEQLIKTAIKDGVSHIVIIHPDSFPIKIGWEKYLENKLSESCVLVSIFPQMSSCMYFHRDFYTKYQPRLLPLTQEESSSSWFSFQKINKATNLIETGMGYSYKIFLEDLDWYKLNRSNRGEYHNHFGSIFENIIFHLGSASEYKNRPMTGYTKDSIFQNFKRVTVNILPTGIKNRLKKVLPDDILYSEVKKNKSDFIKIRKLLLNETEEFLNFLRNGNNNIN